MADKNIFTAISLVFGLALFVPYYINILKKTAKPHLFSWLTWGILTGIGFIASLRGGGGGGAWIFATQAVLCLGVAAYALARGEKNIVFVDWIFFISAGLVILIYLFTKNAIISVFLAATIDLLGFIPTFRKSLSKPHDEPALTYCLAALGFLFSLGALEIYSFVTMFYPSVLVAANIILTLFLLIRRKALPAVKD